MYTEDDNICIQCFDNKAIQISKYDIIWRDDKKVPCCPRCWNELYSRYLAVNRFDIKDENIIDSDNEEYYQLINEE